MWRPCLRHKQLIKAIPIIFHTSGSKPAARSKASSCQHRTSHNDRQPKADASMQERLHRSYHHCNTSDQRHTGCGGLASSRIRARQPVMLVMLRWSRLFAMLKLRCTTRSFTFSYPWLFWGRLRVATNLSLEGHFRFKSNSCLL